MRSAVNTAQNAANTASNTGANAGATAAGINSTVLPFLTRELNNPQGFSQQDKGAMLGAAEGGAGGAAAGLNTEANLKAARDRNSGGFSAALDQVSRNAGKNAAQQSENIEGENANLKQQQTQNAASGLEKMSGLETDAQLKAMGLVPEDVNAEANADKTGWLQNMDQTMAATGEAATGAANLFCPALGSLYTTAFDGQVKVENLKVGDYLIGIDNNPQEIKEIESAIAPILRIETENGLVGRNSRVHTFALPSGGFVEATEALGKIIRTVLGDSLVVSVEPAGTDLVFSVITDGSHTYLADGLWALGVGKAERVTTTDEWAKFGKNLMVN